MMNPFKALWHEIAKLFEKEKPVILSALDEVAKAIKPVWQTALGSLVHSTVQSLVGFSQTNGGEAARAKALEEIENSLKAAGQTAARSTINTLIELAVQTMLSESAKLGSTSQADGAGSHATD